MQTAQELYASTVRDLPPSERLRLAALILDELAQSNAFSIDSSDAWSEEDMHDLATFSMSNTDAVYADDEDLV